MFKSLRARVPKFVNERQAATAVLPGLTLPSFIVFAALRGPPGLWREGGVNASAMVEHR